MSKSMDGIVRELFGLPTESDKWNYKGVKALENKDYKEALKMFNKSLSVDPSNANAIKNKHKIESLISPHTRNVTIGAVRRSDDVKIRPNLPNNIKHSNISIDIKNSNIMDYYSHKKANGVTKGVIRSNIQR